MRTARVSLFGTAVLAGFALTSSADVLIFKNGSRSEVQSVEIRDRAVHIVTLTGQHLALLRDAVDVAATLAANGTRRPSAPPTASKARVERPPSTGSPVKPAEKVAPPLPGPAPPRRPAPVSPPELPAAAPTRGKPEPPRPTEPPAPPGPAPGRPAPSRPRDVEVAPVPHRAALFVNGSLATSPLGFGESRSFELFREPARIDNAYEAPRTQGLELGAFLRLKGPIGVGASLELFHNDSEAAYEALLPHPFYFERFRQLSGRRGGLAYKEQAIHLDGVISKTWRDRLTLDVFAGPSFFFTKTELLLDLLYSEVYPYDAVVPMGVETSVFDDRPLGYNVGATATYRFAGRLGVDFGFRYSRARVRLEPGEQRFIAFDAGGVRAGAGLRFFFR